MTRKPVRVVSQKKSDVICTYASVVNLLQGRKKTGNLESFATKVKKLSKESFLKSDRADMARRKISRAMQISILDVKESDVLARLKPQWQAYWKLQNGARGFVPDVANAFIKNLYSGLYVRTTDVLDAKNAILQFYVNNSFYHAVCIRDGYVIDSIQDIENGDGVYPWEGKLNGYKNVNLMSCYVYPDNLFKK